MLDDRELDLGKQPGRASGAAVQWSAVVLLSLAAVVSYVHRINIAAALPEIRGSFALSAEQAGMLLSAFFWVYTFLQVPAGWLVDRYGVKWPLALHLMAWCLVSACTGLVSGFAGLVAIRVLLGVGESIVTPAGMRYIRTNFQEKRRGLAIGIFMAGTKWGPALGAPLAAYLVVSYGWRAMFIITGLGGLLWLLPWFALTSRDHGAAAAAAPSATAGNPAAAGDSVWRSIFSTPAIWGILVGTFGYNYFVYYCLTWMPTYFKERHALSLTGSGWFTFLSFGGMATIAIGSGLAADWLISRGWDALRVRKMFTIAGLVLASSVAIAAFTDSRGLAIFLAVFSLSGLGLTTPNYWAMTQTLMPSSAIGRVAGLQNTAGNLAGIAAPWITGILVHRTGSFDAPLIAVAILLAASIASYLLLVSSGPPAATPRLIPEKVEA